jgi:y4mF family transcriptional regulator
VRRERIRQGLTQTELALAAGVGKRLIHEIETEKPTARLDTIEQVLAALGLSLRVVRRRDVQAADEEEPPARQRVRRH